MKKNHFLFIAALVAGLWATPVLGADHYVSGMAGISWMNDMDSISDAPDSLSTSYTYDFDSGIILLGAAGCDYDGYRLEAEIGYQKHELKSETYLVDGEIDTVYDIDKGDISVLSLMANGYYDFDLGGFEFYATAGIGVAQVLIDDLSYADDDYEFNTSETTLAWQVGAGLAAPIADGVKIDLRYRYFATTDFTISAWEEHASIASHSLLLGVRVGL
jgi:opacity protein-like surface antigen